MEKEPLLSFVIPAYNAENFIERCLDSIEIQAQFFEVIVVDDGSEDNTPQICDGYAKRDSRFIIIHQDNAGVSSARNVALSKIKGKYFTFVDADDWLDSDFCEKIYRVLEQQQYDVVMFARYFNTDKSELILDFVFDEEKELSNDDMEYIIAMTAGFNEEHQKRDTDLFGWNGCKIYKTSLLRDTKFDEGIKYGEDTLFAMEMLLKLNKMLCIPNRFYHYYIHEESITHKTNKQVTSQIVEMMNKLICCIPEVYRNSKLIDQSIFQRNIYKMMFCLNLTVEKSLSIKESTNTIKRISEIELFSKSLTNVSLRAFRIRNKLRVCEIISVNYPFYGN